jgi:flavin reductase (DIM6/NTAB) family NADH-FMN oxidoreductase RutF
MKKNFPLAKVSTLLGSGPVIMVSTSCKGRPNIMSVAWHTMIDFEPPLIGCVIGEDSQTFGVLKATKQCVINIPTVELVKQVVGCGSTSGRTVDKFEQFKLTALPASCVEAPLVAECYANIECKLVDAKLATKYNLFILEAVKAWITPSKTPLKTIHHLGKNDFMVAGRIIEVPAKKK